MMADVVLADVVGGAAAGVLVLAGDLGLPDVPLRYVVLVVALVLLAWHLTYTAARLDRLHARIEGALTALDAQLVRRAECALELAAAAVVDPASSLILASAATDALAAEDEHSAGRLEIESVLTETIDVALTPEVVAAVRAEGGEPAELVERLAAAGLRVQLALRMHDDAVADCLRVRRKPLVRLFHLAGHTDLPQPVPLDAPQRL